MRKPTRREIEWETSLLENMWDEFGSNVQKKETPRL